MKALTGPAAPVEPGVYRIRLLEKASSRNTIFHGPAFTLCPLPLPFLKATKHVVARFVNTCSESDRESANPDDDDSGDNGGRGNFFHVESAAPDSSVMAVQAGVPKGATSAAGEGVISIALYRLSAPPKLNAALADNLPIQLSRQYSLKGATRSLGDACFPPFSAIALTSYWLPCLSCTGRCFLQCTMLAPFSSVPQAAPCVLCHR